MSPTRSLPTAPAVERRLPLDPTLRPPLLPSPVVRRTGLVNRLRASSAPVVAVVAPAGYGKTTLLAQWIERDRRPAAWLNAAQEDGDEATLLSSVTGAIESLSANGEPLILVIDDVHLLRGAGCGRVLSGLVEQLTPGSTLALAGRREPCIPLARLRTRGHAFELGAAELAMNGHEARALLEAAGAKVSEEVSAELVRRTEGWAAGLHLAASIPDVSGADRFVLDYLRLEVLSELSEATLAFLLHASPLETLCGPLCDSVLDRSDSARMLEELERSQLFLVALDRERTWYRFHSLFREALRSELERAEPGLASELGGRAAAWLEANGLPEAAVEQAQAAGDTERVVRLAATLGAPVLFRGELETVLRWLGGIDPLRPAGGTEPLAALGAWAHALGGSPLEAPYWEEAASRDSGAVPLPSWRGLTRMRLDAELAVETLPAHDVWQPAALTLLGVARLLEGDAAGADASLADAVERAEVLGAPAFAALALAERALLALERGDHALACAQAERASELVEGAGLDAYATSSLVLVTVSRTALRGGAPSRARDALSRVGPALAAGTQPLPWLSVQVCLERARAHLALADAAGAAAALDRADLTLAETGGLGVLDDQARELRRQLDTVPTASGLTPAELRLLPLLATHLSFREIAERLVLSRNTVKTQAISAYRKLGVCSRSEAISKAGELGLVAG